MELRRVIFENQIIEFSNQELAEAFCTENEIDFSEIDIFEKVIEVEVAQPQSVIEKIEFGRILLLEFLQDNNDMTQAFTPQISLQMLNTFAPVKQLCECGDLKNAKYLVSQIEVNSIFTQARKDKYIAMINEFLGV